MKILVTGGAGFIGSHLVDRLIEEGHQLSVIDNFNDFYDPQIKRDNISAHLDQINLIEGDICDSTLVDTLFAKEKFDCVMHLAARAGVRPSIENPQLYIESNIIGTHNLLSAAKKNAVQRFIFASSSSVYGVRDDPPFAESDPVERTISPYAASKLAGEQLCSNYAHLYDMEVICLRFFTVYGPRQRPDLAISKFTRLLLEDRPIDQYGDGSTARDYTYVGDIINGVMGAFAYQFSNGENYGVYNLGGNRVIKLSELITAIESTLDKKATINQLPEQAGDVRLTYASIDKSKAAFGYSPQTSLEEGVASFVQWYQEQSKKAVGA